MHHHRALAVERGQGRAGGVVQAHAAVVADGLPDDRLLTCGKEWELPGGRFARELPPHAGQIWRILVSSDGARLYVAADTEAAIWAVADARRIATLAGHPRRIFTLDLSPDQRRVVTTGDGGTVKLWDAMTGDLVVAVQERPAANVRLARFSPDGARVVVNFGEVLYRVLDATTGTIELTLEASPAPASAPHSLVGAIDARFAPDGGSILSATGSEVLLWSADRAPLLRDIPIDDSIDGGPRGGAVSPAGDRAAVVGADGLAGIWRLDDGARLATFPAARVQLWDAGWSPDGTALAVVGEQSFAHIFAPSAGTPLRTLVGHHGIVNSVEYRPDGAMLVTCGDDRTARLWDAQGEPLRTLAHPDRVISAAWSADGRLATAGWDGALRLWDVATGALVTEIFGGDRTQFLSLAFTPDQRGLVAGSHGGAVSEWDLATRTRRRSFEGHTGGVSWVGFSPDGELLASTADDNTARLWDIGTAQQLAVRVHHGSVMSGHWLDRQRLVTFSVGGRVQVWDAAREPGDVVAGAALVEQHVPWRVVDGRLERRETPGASNPQ